MRTCLAGLLALGLATTVRPARATAGQVAGDTRELNLAPIVFRPANGATSYAIE